MTQNRKIQIIKINILIIASLTIIPNLLTLAWILNGGTLAFVVFVVGFIALSILAWHYPVNFALVLTTAVVLYLVIGSIFAMFYGASYIANYPR